MYYIPVMKSNSAWRLIAAISFMINDSAVSLIKKENMSNELKMYIYEKNEQQC